MNSDMASVVAPFRFLQVSFSKVVSKIVTQFFLDGPYSKVRLKKSLWVKAFLQLIHNYQSANQISLAVAKSMAESGADWTAKLAALQSQIEASVAAKLEAGKADSAAAIAAASEETKVSCG